MKAASSVVAALMLLALAGCTVHTTESPALTGPSGFAQQVTMRAIPDQISQDGSSQSSIEVQVIGPDGRPQSGVAIRVDMVVAGQVADFGTLSARSIVTASDGKARVTYTAPPPPPPTNQVSRTVSIRATPFGTDAAASKPESVDIRLMPIGVILPPAGTPSPCFTTSPTVIAANLPIVFTAGTLVSGSCQAPTSDILVFSWTFGDGTSASGRTVTHTFSSTNTFQVSLTETNDRNVSGTTTVPIAVGSASLPTPLFTFSPTAPGVNETVFFNASTSIAGAGHAIVSYRWTFGDGATASGITTSHAYATAGTYTVQLTVTDEAGQSATSTGTTITLGNPPAPTANFTFSPAQPAVNDTVVFDWRTSTTAQGQRIVSLDWNFGDSTPIVHCPGDPACTADGITTHKFSASGTYAVNLVVTDSAGRTNAKQVPVTVLSGNPTAVLTVTKTGGLSISADGGASTAFGSATITNWTFQWGDNPPTQTGPGSASVAFKTYSAVGTYTVTLIVQDSAGRIGKTTQTVTVP